MLDGDIVISEVMYHPISHDPNEEWIELYNRSDAAIDLTGYRLTSGVDFLFPEATTIEPGGYLVVAANFDAFNTLHPNVSNVVGGWTGQLSNSGERIRLRNEVDTIIDETEYADDGDFAVRRLLPIETDVVNIVGACRGAPTLSGWLWESPHDGEGATLEVINVEFTNDLAQNWGASVMDGTPGRANSVASADIAPTISEVAHAPIIPKSDEPVTITATVTDDTVGSVNATLYYRVSTNSANPFVQVPMFDDGLHGDGMAGDGIFGAEIAAQANDAVVEFYISASDQGGHARTYPAPSDELGGQDANFLYQVDDTDRPEDLITYRVVMTVPAQQQFEEFNHRCSDAQQNATVIATSGAGIEFRYNAGVRYRGSDSRGSTPTNYRLNFPSDRPLFGNTALNINGNNEEDQIAGSALWALAGEPAADAWAVRMFHNNTDPSNGRYFAQVEVTNSDWARRHFPNDSQGNYYRGRRANEGPPGGLGATLNYNGEQTLPYTSYLKGTNRSLADWSDVIELTRAFDNSETPDEVFLETLAEVMDIDQWLKSIALLELTGYNEFGLLIGDARGDDWAMYRGVEDRRFVYVPYDMDTMFEGRTGSIYSATGVPAINRLLNAPGIWQRFYQQFLDVMETLTADNVGPHLTQLLGTVESERTIQNWVNFLHGRADYVNGVIEQELTARSTMNDAGGVYTTDQSTSGVIRGNAHAAKTYSVSVNGMNASYDARNASWSLTDVPLEVGLNRILVQSLDADGVEFDRTYLDVYREGATTSVSGPINADTIWTTAASPYVVTGEVTVDAGATLTIQPGVTVLFQPGTRMVIRGRLSAIGTESELIRFTRDPATGGDWNGLQFTDTTEDNQIHWATLQWGITGNGMVGVERSQLEIDSVAFDDTNRRRIRSRDSSLIVRNSTFGSIVDTIDNQSEHIWGGGIPAGGHFLIDNNVFGSITGHNDSIDFDSPRAPSPIARITNNVFMGGGDDALDMTGDNWIEGNVFRNFIKDEINTDPGESNTISSSQGDFYVIRNVFENIQHASLIKENAFMHFLNNTVINSEFGALYFDLPGQTSGPGRGANIQGNIFQNTSTAIDLTYPPREGVTVDYSLLPKDELGLGPNNRSGTAAVMDLAGGDFRLLDGSGGQGTGRNGFDMGAAIPGGALITGEPNAITHRNSATLLVGGAGITHYRYQLNDGDYSEETPIDTPIELTGLAEGTYVVRVVGKNLLGDWQETTQANASRPWTVVDSTIGGDTSRLMINEVLASNDTAFALANGSHPDFIEIYNDSSVAVSLAGMSLTDDESDPRKFVFPPGTEIAASDYLVVYADADDGSPGIFTDFTLSREGEGVFLFDTPGNGRALIDSITFGMQATDWSMGRDRDAAWTIGTPSPGVPNTSVKPGDPSLLAINEWLAIADVNFSNDYIELYNPLSTPVNMGGLFLTDTAAGWPDRFEIPAHSYVPANGLALFLADGQPEDGPNHVNFGLNPRMETIALHDRDLHLIDMIRYTPQFNDISEGRTPNGSEDITRFTLPNPLVDNPGSIDVRVESILDITDVWRYDESGADLGDQWRSAGYDDSTWLEGGGLLYVENSDLDAPKTTPLTIGSITYYFRKTMTLDVDLASVEEFLVTTYVDDGYALYVNGVEVQRVGMPAGPLDSTTLSLRTVGNAQAESFSLAPSVFRPGENTIAVEVHQTNTGSSDVVFGLALDAQLVTEQSTNANQAIIDGLRISEVMYNPLGGSGFEFLEFQNVGSVPLNLKDVRLENAVEFAFDEITLEAGEYVVVTNNTANFRSRYGDAIRVAGEFDGSLSNGSERIQLVLPDPSIVRVLDFDYQDDWYPETDGDGFSLVAADTDAPRRNWDEQVGWRSSNFINGSPGGEDIGLEPGILVINEVQAAAETSAIEIHNTISSPLDLSGWYLSDSPTDLTKYQIVDGTSIEANDQRVFSVADYGAAFDLNRNGGELFLSSADAVADAAGFIASVVYGAIDYDTSFGRLVTSDERIEFVEQLSATIGGENAGPRVGPIVINEIMYRPRVGVNAEPADEYLELRNTSNEPIELGNYRISGGIDYEFDAEIVPAGGFVLVVGMDPAEFRTRNNIPDEALIVGAYAGTLDDATADIRLERQAEGVEPWILVEHVAYASQSPWPNLPPNVNASINRSDPTAFGNDPNHWSLSIVDGTPGLPNQAPDVTPPTAPTDVSANLIGRNSAEITWSAASDPETEIVAYRVYRDGLAIADTAGTAFVDDSTTGPADYEYRVTAINAQGLESTQSDVGRLSIMSVESVNARFETEVVIRFSEPVTAASAENLDNYSIDGIAISAVALSGGGQIATLTTEPLEQNTDYVLTVNNIVSEGVGQFPPGFTTHFQFQLGVPGFSVIARQLLTEVRDLADADDVLARPETDIFIIASGQGTYPTVNFLDNDGHAHDGRFEGDVPFPHNPFSGSDNFVVRARGVITVPDDQSGDWTFGASVARSDGGTQINVIGDTTEWKYLDDGTDQGTAWRNPGFDDSDWESGPGQLGYGDGDETTVIRFGGDPNNKYPTYYFRNTFEIADAASITAMTGTIVRDDSAAVYVNGVEVYRSNLADNADYFTFANSSTGQENSPRDFSFDPGLLVDGVNTIAVEVHQRALDSSDVSFDMTLNARAEGDISDDGFRLLIDGEPVLNADAQHSSADRLGAISLSPGSHEVEFVFFESTGEAEVELFAAQGTFATVEDTDTWRLVGDTAGGGLSVVTVPEPPRPIEWFPSGLSGIQVFTASAQTALSPSPVAFETEMIAGHSITAISGGTGASISAIRNGATLASSSDAQIGFAILEGFVAPETGTYRFEFTAAETTSFGFVQFELNTQIENELLEPGADNSRPEIAESLDADFGEIASGIERTTLLGTHDGVALFFSENNTLSADNVISFEGTLFATPESTATVQVSAIGDLDDEFEYLTLSIEGLVIEDIFVDDGLDQQNVNTTIELTADQVAQIATDGLVNLTITPSSGVDAVDFSTISVSVFFPDARGDHYRVTLAAEEMLTVYSNSPQIAPTLIDILDPSGVQLASASQTDTAAIIRNFRAATSGEYVIRVRGEAGNSPYYLTTIRNADLSFGENATLATAMDMTYYEAAIGAIGVSTQGVHTFAATMGDVITLSTETPPSGAANLPNTLDPSLTLFDPSGQSLATDGDTLDGRNATLTFTAAETGMYSVVVGRESGDGGYILRLSGNTVTADVLEVVSTIPANGETLLVAPTEIVLDFSNPINAATLSPNSILINGQPTTSVRLVSDTSIAFEIPGSANGDIAYEIPAGAIQALAGGTHGEVTGSFVVDTGPPQIIATRWNDAPAPDNVTLPPGPFSATLQFSEAIDESVLDVSDFQLYHFADGTAETPQSFTYDAATTTITVFFENIDEGSYQFFAASRDDGIRDRLGNLLDGEFDFNTTDGTITGDGSEGGDYYFFFNVEDGARAIDHEFTSTSPFGTSTYSAKFIGTVSYFNDIDPYTLELAAGETLEVVTSAFGVSNVELIDPSGAVVTTAVRAARNFHLESTDITTSGTYALHVTGINQGNTYQVDITRNATLEFHDTIISEPLRIGNRTGAGTTRMSIRGSIESKAPQTLIYGVQPSTAQIVVLDPANGKIINQFNAPDALSATHSRVGLSMADAGLSLIYLNADIDPTTIYHLHPETGEVLGIEAITNTTDYGLAYANGSSFTYDGPAAGDNQRVFVFTNGLIHELDLAQRDTFLNDIASPASDIEGLAFDTQTLYASTASGDLFVIDPAGNMIGEEATTIVASHSGSCLDVAGASVEDDANVQQWSCGDGANQRFTLAPLDTLEDTYLIVAEHSLQCIEVPNSATGNGTSIRQSTCDGGANQSFRLEPNGVDAYRIVATHSDKCVDVSEVSSADGANVIQWDCHDGANQRWRLTLPSTQEAIPPTSFSVPGGALYGIAARTVLGQGFAGVVVEVEPNNDIESAQDIDGFFNLEENPNVEDSTGVNTSTEIPHARIEATGDGTLDYYRFTAQANSKAIFDIDETIDLDSYLKLVDLDGVVLWENDDFDNDPGSTTSLDSQLEYTFESTGVYFIEVGAYPDGSVVDDGTSYVLNVSIENTSLGTITEKRLIDSGAAWRYLDDGSDQGTAWTAREFDDEAWSTGNSQFGYGDGDETTIVSFGDNPDAKPVTTYFRHAFEVFNKNAITTLNLGLLKDDGAAIYLNGVEVARDNLAAEADFDVLATQTISGNNEDLFSSFTLEPTLLVEGTNILAVEVHQASLTSSDLSFDLTLDSIGTLDSFDLPVTPDTDFYSLDMTDGMGQLLDIALFVNGDVITDSEETALNLQLIAPDGSTVVADSASQLADGMADAFVAIRGHRVSENGHYSIRVSSDTDVEYHLVVTENSLLDLEPNDRRNDSLRSLNFVDRAQGYLWSNTAAPARTVDAAGDAVGNHGSLPDIASLDADVVGDNLELTITYHTEIPTSKDWFAYIELDLDQDFMTGESSLQNTIGPTGQRGGPIGVDRRILFFPGSGEAGTLIDNQFNTLGDLPLAIGSRTVDISIPLSMLASEDAPHNGNLDLAMVSGLVGETLAADAIPDQSVLSVSAAGADATADQDLFEMDLRSGDTVSFETITPLGDIAANINQLDPSLEIRDAAGTVLASDLNSAADARNALLQFTADSSGTYFVAVMTEANAGEYQLRLTRDNVTEPAAQVIGRHIFYNNSSFDSNDPNASLDDDLAIAANKQALLPGQTATFANYTSFDKGINGVIIDVAGLAGVPTVNDFEFRVGNNDDVSSWTQAPEPTIFRRANAGAESSDRLVLIWADGAIAGQWLSTTVLATETTGLSTSETFYFGNAIGETGNATSDAKVNATDEVETRNNPHTFADPATIEDAYDFNRDGRVNATDEIIARNHATTFVNELKLITAPVSNALQSNAPSHAAVVNALARAIARRAQQPELDWNSDGVVDYGDLTTMLVGIHSRPGDANLDGHVDTQDLAIWREHRFSTEATYTNGDFDADGVVDGVDFSIWNTNRTRSLESSTVDVVLSSQTDHQTSSMRLESLRHHRPRIRDAAFYQRKDRRTRTARESSESDTAWPNRIDELLAEFDSGDSR